MRFVKTTSVSVRGVDTNVLVRFFTRDDPEQFRLASELIGSAQPGELFLSPVVLVELNWTLLRAYRMPRADVMNVLNGLVESVEFTIGQRELVMRAILMADDANCDFSDALIALLHESAGCRDTVTFDHRALRLPQMRLVGAA